MIAFHGPFSCISYSDLEVFLVTQGDPRRTGVLPLELTVQNPYVSKCALGSESRKKQSVGHTGPRSVWLPGGCQGSLAISDVGSQSSPTVWMIPFIDAEQCTAGAGNPH